MAGVEFFDGTTDLGAGVLANGAYAFNWTTAPVGTHAITAVATDNDGAKTTSAAASLRVNSPPSVTLASPAAGSVYQPGATVPLAAAASDADGTVAGVEFFDGTADLGPVVLVNGSFTFAWANAVIGTHQVTAVATDNDGGTTTSAAVSLRVNLPPVVSVTGPASGAVFLPVAPVTLSTAASDADGTVANVEFFDGATDLGPGVLADGTYSLALSNEPVGTHSFTAVATDNDGAATTSAAVSARVDVPPAVAVTAPATGAVTQPGASLTLSAQASDADGTVSGVEFFDGAKDLGPGVLSNGSFSLAWSNAAAGVHAVTAVATDNDGAATTSPAVSFRVNCAADGVGDGPGGGLVAAGAAVPLSASASDTDGTVANVEFFDGATDLGPGVLSGGVYTFTWNGAAAGPHQVTAVATDNDGGVATSASAAVTADPPPAVSISAAPAVAMTVQQGAPSACPPWPRTRTGRSARSSSSPTASRSARPRSPARPRRPSSAARTPSRGRPRRWAATR